MRSLLVLAFAVSLSALVWCHHHANDGGATSAPGMRPYDPLNTSDQ
jgi:hypothetical protein